MLDWSPLRLGLALDALDAEAEEADEAIQALGARKERPDIVYTIPLTAG